MGPLQSTVDGRQSPVTVDWRLWTGDWRLIYVLPSRNARSFRLLDGWRSLRSALASICRMRSRVTAKLWPTSSRVCSLPSPTPNRILMTFSSRGVSVFKTESVLKTLTPREERVIKMRFGVGDGSEHTLEEVGQNFAVTRERIRQIEAKALRKLRHPSRSRKLRAFLEGRT